MNLTIASIATLIGILCGAITIWVFVRPTAKRSAAVADAILGEEVVYDRAGKEIQPARPGLVSRVGSVEHAVALLVETNTRLDNHGVRLENHEERLKTLELGRVERIVMHAENAAVLGLVGDEIRNQSAPKSTDPTAPEIED